MVLFFFLGGFQPHNVSLSAPLGSFPSLVCVSEVKCSINVIWEDGVLGLC
jgi:hypothetical protein